MMTEKDLVIAIASEFILNPSDRGKLIEYLLRESIKNP